MKIEYSIRIKINELQNWILSRKTHKKTHIDNQIKNKKVLKVLKF